MYIHAPCFDLDELARDNLHIHTSFSRCAKPEMTVENIFAEAARIGYRTIALTDHYNDDIDDEEALRRLETLREQGQKFGEPCRVLYGMELSGYGIGKTLEGDKLRNALDYRLYSCNHYHLDFWEQAAEITPRAYAEHALENVTSLIKSGKPDCIAHPLTAGYIRAFEDKTLVSQAITDNELGDIMTLAKEHEVAWELNIGNIYGDPEFSRRMWNIGRELGSCFNMGADAHLIKNIDFAPHMSEIKKIFGI